MKATAVIVAAGRGTRMGVNFNKVFLPLFGRTILETTVSVFDDCNVIDEIVVVNNDAEECARLLKPFKKVSAVVCGGNSRQESVRSGLSAAHGEFVLIHDGARALITKPEIENVLTSAEKYGAATVGVKCKDTLKRADSDGFIAETVDREFIYNIQTPQVFRTEEIKKMHEAVENEVFTDDCALAEQFGSRIKIVDGSYDNIKITTPDDLILAEKILRIRSGKNENRSGI
ncbi:MAG: 2-C-methyl-D-erythritol 4-phosphate cytidylyltransferase [Firmicutes bacterium]|nr:2-C-methyl-D-erythritol 4-phosphate cytidylyltransferase [Bacillota bacterium]